jgi:ATP-dependent Lhr-like helicase
MGTLRGEEDRGDALSRVLLARYGILCREIVEREGGPADWASLSIPLARMELRGEIRRGYFVAGLSGIQYALPEAVEMLRSRVPEPLAAPGDTNARSLPAARGRDRPLILVNATDPANLYGGEAAASVSADDRPALRFARVPSTHLLLIEGEPVLVAEDGGERMTAGADIEPDTIHRMVSTYLQRPNAPRHVVVRQWNSEAILGSSAEEVLHSVGFSRTPDGMEWWSGTPT